MPLNLTVNDGEFTPYIKYNAKAGRWYVRPQGAQSDVEVERPLLAIDMANIRTGWLYYAEGSGPEKIWDPSPTQTAPKPPGPKKFKRGFEVMVFGNTELPGIGKLGLREFSSTAGSVIGAILNMHAAYEAGIATNPGKVPFYACTGVVAIPGAFGTNYEPVFELRGWVDRAKVPAFDEAQDRAPPQQHVDERNPPMESFNAPLPGQQRGAPANGGHAPFDDDIPFSAEFR